MKKMFFSLLLMAMLTGYTVIEGQDFGGGSGTAESPWRIETAQHLYNIRDYVGAQHSDKHFMQTMNIDLGIPPYNTGEGWQPLSGINNFMGNYNGNNYQISNLTISRESTNQSLFGRSVNATISNVRLVSVNISGRSNSGGLVSTTLETFIRNVEVSGTISGEYNVGGIAGSISDESTISTSFSSGNVSATGFTAGVGGIAGSSSNSIIRNSYSSMDVSGRSRNVGGLVGVQTQGSIENCLATGLVIVESTEMAWHVGGLVGSGSGTVLNSFWNIESTGQDESAGGEGVMTEQLISRDFFSEYGWSIPHVWDIVDGETYPYLSWQGEPGLHNRPGPYNLRATGCFVNENILLEWDMAGEPVRYRVYRDDDMVAELDHPQMNWEDNDVEMIRNYKYKIIAIFDEESQYPSPRSGVLVFGLFPFPGGSGTEEDPYQVSNAAELDMVRLLMNSYFIQTADINLAQPPWTLGEGWVPIGRPGTSSFFSGYYDGNGYLIRGLTINRDEGGQGLFGQTRNAVLMNIALEDVDLTAQSTGALATHSQQTTVTNCYATGIIHSRTAGGLINYFSGVMNSCWTDVDIWASSSNIGGLVGESQGEISDCYALGNIVVNPRTASHSIGGLIGSLRGHGGSVYNSYASGNVEAPLNIDTAVRLGGFVGLSDGLLNNSYASGNVSGGREVGGFIGFNSTGYNTNGVANNSYASGNVQGVENTGGFVGFNRANVNNCYSIGSVSGETTFGGFIGNNEGEVRNSFWNVTTSNNDESAAGTGLNHEQMFRQANFINWDFDDVWSITEGISYPWLQWQQQPGRQNIAGPYNLEADPDNDNLFVDLDWEMRGEPEFYRIYRNGEVVDTVNHPVATYRDENLLAMFRYQYEVSAMFSVDGQQLETMLSNKFKVVIRGSFTGGDGSSDNPYQVDSVSSLSLVREHLDAHFIQTADIDLGVNPWNMGEGWEPIGTSESQFQGVYDGNGFVIEGLTVNRPRADNQSLFGEIVEDATIRNLGLLNIDITGKDYTAGIAGKLGRSSRVERSFVTGSITGHSFVGAVAGYAYSGSTIRDCYSSAEINVISNDQRALAGGIVAYAYWGIIERCYAVGDLYTAVTMNNTGAVVGHHRDSNLSSLYWNSDTVNIDGGVGNDDRFPGSSTNELIRQDTYQGFDFEGAWSIQEDLSYAYLSWQEEPGEHNRPILPPRNLTAVTGTGVVNLSWQLPSEELFLSDGYFVYREGVRLNDEPVAELEYVDETVDSWQSYSYYVTTYFDGQESVPSNAADVFVYEFAGGIGSADEPYKVATARQLTALIYAKNAHFKQVSDIDLEEWYSGDGGRNRWEPIGTMQQPFRGSFNGNYYTIRNLHLHRTTGLVYVNGLFGYTEDAELSNIGLIGVNIEAISESGGIVGRANNTLITDCYVDGRISVTGTGGAIAGQLQNNSSVVSCYASGTIRANHSSSIAGGLVGINNSSKIKDSFSAVRVIGNYSYSAGLAAVSNDGNVINCFAYGLVTSTNANPEYSGGLLARNDGCEVVNSYWDTETSGQDISAGGEGRTTEQMTYPYDENTYVDWDFINVWKQDDGGRMNSGYPYLKWLNKLLIPYPDVASKPLPEDGAKDVPLELEALSWEYLSSLMLEDPVGFRVYFNETGEFTEDDEYEWVDYIVGEENYHCSDALPQLEGLTTYYWKVIPTTNEPELRAAESEEQRAKSLEQRAENLEQRDWGGERRDWSRRQNDKTTQLATRHSPLTTRGDAQNVPVWIFTTIDPTNIEANDIRPYVTDLQGNFPNPFNPETTISFSLAEAGEVTLEIFNIRGQRVVKLVDEYKEAGIHRVIWNSRDSSGRTVGSGVYLYRMKTRDYDAAGKMILMK